MSVFRLTAQQLEQFKTQGLVGPFPFLSDDEARLLKTELRRCFELTRGFFYPEQVQPGVSYYNDMPWFQSLHSLSPTIRAVGQRPEVVDRVSQLLGDNLMQWDPTPPPCVMVKGEDRWGLNKFLGF